MKRARKVVDDSSTVGEQFGLLQTLCLFMAVMHLQVQAQTPCPAVLIVAPVRAHERGAYIIGTVKKNMLVDWKFSHEDLEEGNLS